MIIHDTNARVATYLENIRNLWQLDQEQRVFRMNTYEYSPELV